MKPDHLKQLFTAAARAETPAGADDLSSRVARAIRRETMTPAPSLFDQLGLLLPRVAVAAAAVLVVCLLVEYSIAGDLSTSVTQLSEQWLFATN